MEYSVKLNFSDSFLSDLDVDTIKVYITNLGWKFYRNHLFGNGEIYKNGKSKIHLYLVMSQKQKLKCLIEIASFLNVSIFTLFSNFGFSFDTNSEVQKFENAISLLRSWIYELQPISMLPPDEWSMSSIGSLKSDFDRLEHNTFNFLREIDVDLDT